MSRFACGSLAAVAMLNVSACGPPDAQTRIAARQAALDPPSLWLVEVIEPAAQAAAVRVCADRKLQEGLARADAVVNGQPCLVQGQPLDRPGLYAARCEAGGRRFSLNLTSSGDPARDLRVDFALQPLDTTGPGARQTRRYHRLGPCPPGWKIGDQARRDGSGTKSSLE